MSLFAVKCLYVHMLLLHIVTVTSKFSPCTVLHSYSEYSIVKSKCSLTCIAVFSNAFVLMCLGHVWTRVSDSYTASVSSFCY